MNDKTPLEQSATDPSLQIDENHLINERREKLARLRQQGLAYPNDFVPTHLALELHQQFNDRSKEELADQAVYVKMAGRMLLKRVMGKASFATVQDRTGQIQFYINDNETGEESHTAFKHWDMGDIIAAEGLLFKTNRGELSVQVKILRLLTKSLRPLPEKFHGLTSQEMKYRQRYVDLIVSPKADKHLLRGLKQLTPCVSSCKRQILWRSKHRCYMSYQGAHQLNHLLRTTMLWIWKCSCALPQNSI